MNASGRHCESLLQDLARFPQAEKIGKFGFAFPPGKAPERLLDRNLVFWLENGAVSFQAAGSMLVMEELGACEWRSPVWDCCCGSGGKTALLLERGVRVALASDTSAKRLANLLSILKNSGLGLPCIIRANAAMPPLSRWDGHILADVPCSGLGVLSRRPDIMAAFSVKPHWPEKAQKNILDGLAAILRPGAELIYITCSINPAENERMTRKALKDNPGLDLVAEWQTPHFHPWLEGMYGAKLRKKLQKSG